MKFTGALLGLGLSIFFAACSPDEPVISNTDTGWTIVAATAEQPSQLAVLHEPDNLIKTADAFTSANGVSLSGTVRKIAAFDTTLYLLLPDQKIIEVISRSTYKRLATIQTAPHRVADLCFANATTAYTANDDSTVSIIDMTVYQLLAGRDIRISSPAVAIAALGNQLCAVCQSANCIDIIDTPTNTVARSVATPPVPTYVGADQTNGNFVVACLGFGKLSSSESMTPAHLVVYSLISKSISGDITMTHGGLSNEEVLPRCLLVLDNGFAYVGLNTQLALLDTRSNIVLGSTTVGSFSSFATNLRRNEAVFFDNLSNSQTQYSVVDLSNSSIKSSATLPIRVASAIAP